MNKDALVVGLALFAMFFGAGNLIFPPYLGMESGELWPLGLACFVFFDVVVSCVGVFAINNAGAPSSPSKMPWARRPAWR